SKAIASSVKSARCATGSNVSKCPTFPRSPSSLLLCPLLPVSCLYAEDAPEE
ncbi:unnamed protein product, partial [Closterium sp. Naga37s-1]